MPADASTGDFALLDAWRAGDRRAGTQLFDRHFAAVVRFFKNKAPEGYDDLVQQTFLGCVEGRDRFEGRSSFRTYLFAVAHNILKSYYRGKKRDRDRYGEAGPSVHDLAPRATTLLARRDEEEIVLQSLRRLPMDDQVILELYFWENLRAVDIGEALGMPEPTVRTRIRRARIKLESFVEDLSDNQEQLHRTRSGLEDWVAGIRGRLREGEPPT